MYPFVFTVDKPLSKGNGDGRVTQAAEPMTDGAEEC